VLELRKIPCLDDSCESFKLILGKVGGARESAKEVGISGAYFGATSAIVDG
jgi:hypothetical protein